MLEEEATRRAAAVRVLGGTGTGTGAGVSTGVGTDVGSLEDHIRASGDDKGVGNDDDESEIPSSSSFTSSSSSPLSSLQFVAGALTLQQQAELMVEMEDVRANRREGATASQPGGCPGSALTTDLDFSALGFELPVNERETLKVGVRTMHIHTHTHMHHL